MQHLRLPRKGTTVEDTVFVQSRQDPIIGGAAVSLNLGLSLDLT